MKVLLIDVINPSDGASDGVAAAQSFLDSGDRVVLYHALHHATLEKAELGDEQLLREAKSLLIDARRRALQQIAECFAPHRVSTHVEWTDSRWQGLLKLADSENATMVIARSQRSASAFSNKSEDWQLIRHASIPLLLTRESGDHDYNNVLAAIDPLHVDDKPAELDHRILGQADSIAKRNGATLCVLNVVNPLPPVPIPAAAAGVTTPFDQTIQIDACRARVEELVEQVDCDADEICVLPGLAAAQIVEHSRAQDSDLVVMGAVSRSMLRNALIGNTAEKVLRKIDADTLILKPEAAGPFPV